MNNNDNENLSRLSKDRAKKKRHPIRRVVFLLLFILVMVVGAYALRVYTQTKSAADGFYHPGDSVSKSANIKNGEPFTILLMGVDTGADGRVYKGNSDTMILATVNPKTKKTTLTSIPRDTAAQIYGTKKFTMEKINAAYNIGGSKMAMNTVSKLLNVPVDYYVTVNMGGLKKLVDAVGGVDVDSPFAFTSAYTGGQHFPKGKQHLNGSRALAYARMRHEDPEGDYGRQKRQMQVIQSIVKSALSLKTLTNYENILNSLKGQVATNLTFNDMVTLQSNYRDTAKNLKRYTLEGQNGWIGDGAYEIASTKELQKTSDRIRQDLGLKKETLSNQETRMNKLNPNFDPANGNDQYYIYKPGYAGHIVGTDQIVGNYNGTNYGSGTSSSKGTATSTDSSSTTSADGDGSSNYGSTGSGNGYGAANTATDTANESGDSQYTESTTSNANSTNQSQNGGASNNQTSVFADNGGTAAYGNQ